MQANVLVISTLEVEGSDAEEDRSVSAWAQWGTLALTAPLDHSSLTVGSCAPRVLRAAHRSCCIRTAARPARGCSRRWCWRPRACWPASAAKRCAAMEGRLSTSSGQHAAQYA